MKRNSINQTDQDSLCGICMKRKVSANVDCCSHQFCSTCIKDWVKGQTKSCPLCRRDVNTIISIKTGGILYKVRREPDHVPTIQLEPDNQDSSILDFSHRFESESHYEEQSSIVSEILGYFGYSAEQQESQDNSIQQKPKRKREKTSKTSKQKPAKTLGGDQILSKLQTEKQKESQNKKPSSAFHKRNKKQSPKALTIQQIKIQKKKSKKQQLDKVQSELMHLEDEYQQNEEHPFFNSKIVQQHLQAKKRQERQIQIQRESQKVESVVRQSKLKQKQIKQSKSVLRSKQAEIKRAFNDEDIELENWTKDRAYRRQLYGSRCQSPREKDEYGRRQGDDSANSQYKIDQYNKIRIQQRQRKQELRSQILAYENQKKRKEQQFRKQYERMMQQNKKKQETGILNFISQYKWILGCLGIYCCCCRCCCLC